ncbi:sensor histidine kinase [Fibrisoma limi]|nr:histidine kinase [Fibrisoma limi]
MQPVGVTETLPNLLGISLSFSLVVLLSSLLVLFKERTRIKEEQQQAVLEKVQAELAMLKLQISPHFLFNTLNNISWLARKRSDKTESAVIQLSQLLRYIIYKPEHELVSLREEIQHLEHYIHLQQMRLAHNTTVQFTCQGPVSVQMIKPLLLIPFVENAFKHGVHSYLPSRIEIGISVEPDRLLFYTRNPIFTPESTNGQTDGIGVNNTRRRLNLSYPGLHTLRIDKDGQRFCVSLEICFTS